MWRGQTGDNDMRTLILTTATLVALGTVSVAQAGSLGRPCTTVPESQWLSLDALQSKVEQVGFKVQKSKLSRGCAEFYATAQTGERMELFVDPATGTIIDGR
jgi:hypothetical protein